MRAFLARTESFVYNQITTLRRYRAVVAAHHRRPVSDYPLGEGVIAEEVLPEPLATCQRLAYRAMKIAAPPGQAALARYLRDEDARLLHYHFLTDARFLLGVQRRLDLPAVVSAYGYDVTQFPQLGRGLGRRYLRPIFDRFDLFLAMSEAMRNDLLALGCPESKVEVHYHGIDTRRFRCPERSYVSEGPTIVLCCSRLIEIKGLHLVLRALSRVKRRGRNQFRVVIVGDGPMRAELERAADSDGLRGVVTFAGHVPYASAELPLHYRRADVFAHPSFTIDGVKEGIPGTIVEAMASGLPVVATRHAGIPAVIRSERDGILVAERDEDALAGALESLIENPRLRESLGKAAADRAASELDLAAGTAELERIYDRWA